MGGGSTWIACWTWLLLTPQHVSTAIYFDAVVYHLYFNPRQTPQVISAAKGLLAAHAIGGKEIWINETNAPPSADPQEPPWAKARFGVSLPEQSAFVIQEFALAFASGAARVELYKLRNSHDHPESIEPFGLVRGDGSRRPAFAAYRTLVAHVSGFHSARLEVSGPLYAVTFDRGQTTTTILWTTGRSAVNVPVLAIAPRAQLVDETGQARELVARGGAYEIALPGATCSSGDCFIGGAPRLLLEEGNAGGRLALQAAIAPTASPTSPAATRTSTPVSTPSTATPRASTSPAATRAVPTRPAATATLAPSPTASPSPTATPSPTASPSSVPLPPATASPTGTAPPTPTVMPAAVLAAPTGAAPAGQNAQPGTENAALFVVPLFVFAVLAAVLVRRRA